MQTSTINPHTVKRKALGDEGFLAFPFLNFDFCQETQEMMVIITLF